MNEERLPSSGKGFDLNRWTEVTQSTMDRFIDVARVESAYGEPVTHGDQLLITTAEVVGFMGMGFGGGSGYGSPSDEEAVQKSGDTETKMAGGEGGGGGGGGNVLSRPVALIIASPQGVRVEPIVDVTKLGLAALTAFGFMAATLFKMSSYRRAVKSMKDLKG